MFHERFHERFRERFQEGCHRGRWHRRVVCHGPHPADTSTGRQVDRPTCRQAGRATGPPKTISCWWSWWWFWVVLVVVFGRPGNVFGWSWWSFLLVLLVVVSFQVSFTRVSRELSCEFNASFTRLSGHLRCWERG